MRFWRMKCFGNSRLAAGSRVRFLTALFLVSPILVACSAAGPSSADADGGDAGGVGASVDAGETLDTSVDAGRDGGALVDGGLGGLCETCGLTAACDRGLDCRLAGGGFGYCARFLPTCPGLAPDIAAVKLEYGWPCRSGGIACSIHARLQFADAGLAVTGQSFFGDGGLSETAARYSTPESVDAWRPLAVGCYSPEYVFPDDSCLTHSDYFVLRFELSDGGVAGVEFSGGSSTLPSRPFIAAVTAIVQAAERALDGGP